MALQRGGGKNAGKTEFSGRRRTATRRAGFGVQGDCTGGELRVIDVPQVALLQGDEMELDLELPRGVLGEGQFFGIGGWFCISGSLSVSVTGVPKQRLTITAFTSPDWNKVGALWEGDGAGEVIQVRFRADAEAHLAVWGFSAGVVGHEYMKGARAPLLRNMHLFAPEANFIVESGKVTYRQSDGVRDDGLCRLHLKSCNRCQRYLPINIYNERNHLSFSNHCVADHRRPCRHATFGRLRVADSAAVLQLDYGYQLECRFCKKFEVNAAHNPQRTMAQMKEDAARRRAIEVLVGELLGGAPQLRHRAVTERELADEVLARFEGCCFKCGIRLLERSWHLDHTRPLALLWPLDRTATALCSSCNAEKRDRTPGQFYTNRELERLAALVGLSVEELKDTASNPEVAGALLARLDWFFGEFLASPEMTEVQEGKMVGELLVKAVQKALSRLKGGAPLDLALEWERYRRDQAGRSTRT